MRVRVGMGMRMGMRVRVGMRVRMGVRMRRGRSSYEGHLQRVQDIADVVDEREARTSAEDHPYGEFGPAFQDERPGVARVTERLPAVPANGDLALEHAGAQRRAGDLHVHVHADDAADGVARCLAELFNGHVHLGGLRTLGYADPDDIGADPVVKVRLRDGTVDRVRLRAADGDEPEERGDRVFGEGAAVE
jgi:hypothetical protein